MVRSVRSRHHRYVSAVQRPGNPLNVHANKDLVYSHAITHSKRYQKGVGKSQAKKEHAAVARIMKKRGFVHETPFH